MKIPLYKRIADWGKDWKTHRVIEGVDYSSMWPHVPRMTYAEWMKAMERMAEAIQASGLTCEEAANRLMGKE